MPQAQCRQDFRAPGPAPEDEAACQQQGDLDVGLTWASIYVGGKERHPCAPSRGFGKEMGEELLCWRNLQARRRRIHDDIHDLWRQKVWRSHVLETADRTENVQKFWLLLTVKKSLSIFAFVTTGRTLFGRGDLQAESGASRPIEYAPEPNASISTYSNATIAEAQFGHAKRDPDKQDQCGDFATEYSGDIVFAHMYEGAIVTSLHSPIFFCMRQMPALISI